MNDWGATRWACVCLVWSGVVALGLASGRLWATPADGTGTIEGEVEISGSAAKSAGRSGYVVWIDDVPGGFRPDEKHAVMDQKDFRFIPHILPVLAGTIVDFPNSDPLLHNVFSISEAKRFNLGLYPKGQVLSVKFDKPGVVEILCHVHPSMSAYIIVLKNPFFTVTGADGRFRIANVPAGAATLRCWSEHGQTAEQNVVVNPGGIHTVKFKPQSALR